MEILSSVTSNALRVKMYPIGFITFLQSVQHTVSLAPIDLGDRSDYDLLLNPQD